MPVEVVNCEQGSEAWFKARIGIPTASCFADLLAKGQGKTRQKYLYRLAGELITGQPTEGYTNHHMERGKVMEAEARAAYAFLNDAEPELVGFIRNGRAGCSPDSLLGASGLLEIKTKIPSLMVETHLRGELPPEHRAQCQGQLWVAEREWIDFVAYWPGFPPFIHRCYREPAFIVTLAQEVARFNEELDTIVERLRGRAA